MRSEDKSWHSRGVTVRESRRQKARRATKLLERLERAYPRARTALEFDSPMELLAAVVLSAQCTDVRVNAVTPALFARFRTPADFAAANPEQLEPFIESCGLYHAKARALAGAGREIVERFGGAVPTRRADLATLPGVGNKTAGVVSMHLSDEAALPVDTHVARLAFRLGLSRAEQPDAIERDLSALWPKEKWKLAHHALIWHGRTVCLARALRCSACPVERLCPKRGVSTRSAAR